MRNLRRQVQHGPTCRSILILCLGVFILSLTSRPRFRQSHLLRLGRLADGNDELRQVRVRPGTGFQGLGGQRRSTTGGGAEEEEAQAQAQAGSGAGSSGGQHLTPGAIHVALTSNGSPYMNWQTRVMYYTYLQVATSPGSDMKYFTRILHRKTPDSLMDVIPTYRVDPLDPSCDTWCEYPVASRPAAISDWLHSDDVRGEWVAMIETDYVFVRPLSVPASGRALGFPFNYVTPSAAGPAKCVSKYSKGVPSRSVQGTGNAPVIIKAAELRKVVPEWVLVTAAIEVDKECKETLGWVREMYAFSIACATAGVRLDLPRGSRAIMSQPPADEEVGDAAILHYTWGNQIKDPEGKVVWEFEKRKFTDRGLPDRIPDPPADKVSEAQAALVAKVNSAIEHLPKYTAGELQEMGRPTEGGEGAGQGNSRTEGEQQQQQQPQEQQEGQHEEGRQEEAQQRDVQQQGTGGGQLEADAIHVMLTSNGNPYMNWQTLLMYHTYREVAEQPGSRMKYFTRVLHRTQDDELMDRIPTMRVQPLHPECDGWCDYPVADRPDAILQWLRSGDVKGDWVLMVETDYVFVKPVAIPPSGRALGFEFGYIIPTWPTIRHIMIRYFPGDLKKIPQTGNAPVLAKTEDLMRVVPRWVDVTARFENDSAAKKELGWVREMYAFSLAMALEDVPIDLPRVPNAIMVQPPADNVLGAAAIIHYTWGFEFKEGNSTVWKFEKRDFTQPGQHPHVLPPLPPQATGLQVLFINKLNDAIRAVYPE